MCIFITEKSLSHASGMFHQAIDKKTGVCVSFTEMCTSTHSYVDVLNKRFWGTNSNTRMYVIIYDETTLEKDVIV